MRTKKIIISLFLLALTINLQAQKRQVKINEGTFKYDNVEYPTITFFDILNEKEVTWIAKPFKKCYNSWNSKGEVGDYTYPDYIKDGENILVREDVLEYYRPSGYHVPNKDDVRGIIMTFGGMDKFLSQMRPKGYFPTYRFYIYKITTRGTKAFGTHRETKCIFMLKDGYYITENGDRHGYSDKYFKMYGYVYFVKNE